MTLYQPFFALPHTLAHEDFCLDNPIIHHLCQCPAQEGTPSSYFSDHLIELASPPPPLLGAFHQPCLSLLAAAAPNLSTLWPHHLHHACFTQGDGVLHVFIYAESLLAHATNSVCQQDPTFVSVSRSGQKNLAHSLPAQREQVSAWASWSAWAKNDNTGRCHFQSLHFYGHP